MEWSELQPEDRRTLKALLNLDDNGHKLPTVETSPEQSTEVTAGVAVPTTVTLSELKAGIADQVSLVYQHWTAVRRLSLHHKRKPHLQSCRVTSIRHIMDGIVFKDFMVVYAEVEVVIGFRTTTRPAAAEKKRSREENDNDESADVVAVNAAAAESTPTTAARDLETLVFHTMHFVHRTTPNVGYEVQSVIVPNAPLDLQCVAGNIIQFALLTWMRLQYGTPPNAGESWDTSKLRLPQSGDVVILGMGGNVMANCLVHLLPHTVPIHVVEIEPSVVAVCSIEGQLPSTPNFHVHVCDVVVALKELKDASCALIILDCFDPLVGEMESGHSLLTFSKSKLLAPAAENASSGGLLMVNLHRRPTQSNLQVFFDVFGEHRVEAIDLPGAKQCFVACSLDPIPTLTPKPYNLFGAAAATYLKSLTPSPFECPVPVGVKGGQSVVSKNTDHVGWKPFRAWAGEDDVSHKGRPTKH
ncbi:Hypothetical protein, putative [Bodo saltans]|uniref:Spermidine synthase n=1 Tax=Bodo saltans TaxID=75058 RepID=A0A0S4JEA8_BODSA|nr:Hypothetical protein, putative [Bodo saltans]|eukprot:CUG88779.1 Hypothetical protein, putative [Bodo saltans]